MAGTRSGGQAAAATNKAKYGEDFYAMIGSKGGRRTYESGKLALVSFANDDRTLLQKLRRAPKRAVVAGRKGGKTSRRPKVIAVTVAEPPVRVAPAPGPRTPLPPILPPAPPVAAKVKGYWKPIRSAIPPFGIIYIFIREKRKP